ncbi:sensor histidine kinase RegB [Methyloglobulus morosus KoM1]|uniref:histidine kinase n=1 Tax=Methyloglobulus morosus KoM1 TaxID=1116472 RepID=V5E3A4_9GAMM|nr:ATP-binding protein [Methyloglobulus morosus]ESS74026.1 sensor histidine kinase RegB [Methyloglobulus morosus KoM1]
MLSFVLPKSEISALQNLKWLFILRNMMILGESFLVVMFVYILNISIPEQQLWLVIVAIIAFNAYTSMRLQTDDPVTELEIFSQICIDVLSIAGLLYLTGGASNPITWVFLLPLIITAIMLPQSYAWYMVILTTSMYTILIGFNIPLPSIEPHMPNTGLLHPSPIMMANEETMQKMHAISDNHYYNLHMFGMWFGFVFSAGLVAFFVAELARMLKHRERSLAEARENALRDERVVALGTLAASAAHDMGTPLGTIAIVVHELMQDYPVQLYPEINEKMDILENQVNRCKEALSLMSASAGEMRAESGTVMLVSDYIDNVLYQWRSHKPTAKLHLDIDPGIAVDAQLIAERTLTHALINVLNNAAEASDPERGIEFYVSWSLSDLTIKIRDFGSGFPDEIIKFNGNQPVNSKNKGLGVGLFLAHSTIHRMGGKINLSNLETGGACVEINLPLSMNTEIKNDL